MIFGASFIADGGSHLMDQFLIPRRRHANCLRKHGGASATSNAVKRLTPIVIGRNIQARDGLRRVNHQAYFFFESETSNQIFYPLGQWKGYIEIQEIFRCVVRTHEVLL